MTNTDTFGQTIPAIGLGTWKAARGVVGQAVASAIDIGYRHIDCAPIYQNEKEIGEAFAEVMGSGGVVRQELWVTSKLWNNGHRAKHVRPALERTLKDLQLDYLDLFLIHWPVHFKAGITFPRQPDEYIAFGDIPLEETWQAMEKMVKAGLTRHIGVCNFNLGLLGQLLDLATIPPLVNQIELHPYLQQQQMVDFCQSRQVLLTAYSPLGSGDRPTGMKKDDEPTLLGHPQICAIAEKHRATPAQVLLAWGLSRRTIVIPKSVSPERQRENLRAQELQLDGTDLAALGSLDCGYRYVDGAFFTGSGSPYSLSWLWD